MVLDMATSAIAYFELVDRARRGAPAPPDVGFDAAGRETTDPAAILDGGAIRPFDRLAQQRNSCPVQSRLLDSVGCRLCNLSTHDQGCYRPHALQRVTVEAHLI